MKKCINCGKLLSKDKYKRCNSCNAKNQWRFFRNKLINSIKVSCNKRSYILLRRRLLLKNNPNYNLKTKLKQSESKINSKNPNWLGGISFYPYSIKFNSFIKNKIRNRDKYKCRLCNKKGNCVHHIDYNKQNCKENNLITLCRRCHTKTNYNRYYWKTFLKNLLGVK
jgi:hypothetical protein